ncbi:RHS repeat-associated core domain-containing protein, partial [Myxococcota bacterium]|nr:RHS repeat-associated core domain-containing protein [Myxococcota bacterium]
SVLGNPIRYTGRFYDETTGLYDNRLRNYHPVLGRFIEPDPIGPAGGINLYAYVNSNPINFIDPLGLAPIPGSSSGTGSEGYVFSEGNGSGGVGSSPEQIDSNNGFWGDVARGASAKIGFGAGLRLKTRFFPLKFGGGVVFGSGGVGLNSKGLSVWGNSTLDAQLSAGPYGVSVYLWDIDVESTGVNNIDVLGGSSPTWDWSIGVGVTISPYSLEIKYDFQPIIDNFTRD